VHVKKEGNPSKQNKTQERLLPIYEKFGRVSIYILWSFTKTRGLETLLPIYKKNGGVHIYILRSFTKPRGLETLPSMFHNHITCEGKDARIDEITLHVQNAFGWNARSRLIERDPIKCHESKHITLS